jgi:hypothetical protein
LTCKGFAGIEEVALDHVWSAIWWKIGGIMDEIVEEVIEEELMLSKG